MKFTLLSVLAVLGSAVAAPISLNKRSLPRLGGVNIAVSSGSYAASASQGKLGPAICDQSTDPQGCEFGVNVWGWSGTRYVTQTERAALVLTS